MKKFTRVVLAGVAVTTLLSFTGDNAFEGVVTFSMNASGGENPQAAAMMQGSSMVDYFKGDKVRTEITAGMFHQVLIMDRKTKEVVTLVDMMGNKYEIKPDAAKQKEEDEKNKPEIKELDSTKTIAGYMCHAASVTSTDPRSGEKGTFIVYYTDQLPYSSDFGMYKGLKGFPMQYTTMQQGMNITMMAKNVEKKSLSDTLFAIPTKGYKVVSTRQEMMKDIQQDMGGGGN